MALSPGSILGPYEIHSRVGTGGTAEIWRARDHRLGREVAVKVLPDDDLVQGTPLKALDHVSDSVPSPGGDDG